VSRQVTTRLRALDDFALRHVFLFVGAPALGLSLVVYGALSWSWMHADWGPGAVAARADSSYHRVGTITFAVVLAAAVCLLVATWQRLRGRRYWAAALLAVALVVVVAFGGHMSASLELHSVCACDMS
jgi:lysylphosphatidylglycerol synthetase-like protein (DUF2156 family)